MKGIMKEMERIFSAVAFAEAGEFDTARQIMSKDEREAAMEEKEVHLFQGAHPVTDSGS